MPSAGLCSGRAFVLRGRRHCRKLVHLKGKTLAICLRGCLHFFRFARRGLRHCRNLVPLKGKTLAIFLQGCLFFVLCELLPFASLCLPCMGFCSSRAFAPRGPWISASLRLARAFAASRPPREFAPCESLPCAGLCSSRARCARGARRRVGVFWRPALTEMLTGEFTGALTGTLRGALTGALAGAFTGTA